MRILLALVVALIAAVVASFVTGMLGLGFLSSLVSIGVFIVVFFMMKRGAPIGSSRVPDGFNADFAHDNIAIDTASGKLWLRDKSGASTVVDKGDVLRWNLAFMSRGAIHLDSRLEVHVRDLKRPKFEVPFRRHGETWKWGAARNHAEAEEWVSRLTTWVQTS